MVARSKKAKTAYVCTDCGAEHKQWQGQCASCSQWNTLSRVSVGPVASGGGAQGYAGTVSEVKMLVDVDAQEMARIESGIDELDRVLGGGFVPGSVVLLGGDPGAGKSTLLLQVSTELAKQQSVLYVSGEESLQQLAMRARRLGLPLDQLQVAAETRAEAIAELIAKKPPAMLILDSIQVMQLESIDCLLYTSDAADE